MLNRLHKFHPASRWMIRSWILAFMSLILIGFTVDYFGKIQPLFFFVLGSIGWASNHQQMNQILRRMTQRIRAKKQKNAQGQA